MCLAEQDLSRGFKKDFKWVNMAVLTEKEGNDGHLRHIIKNRGEEKKNPISGSDVMGLFHCKGLCICVFLMF